MIDGLYLGGTVPTDGSSSEISGPFAIDAEDLRTHGVVVGMTGSGKTGLCLVLLEELARAGVPVIAIDPKGDLANLGLLFPKLQAEDFAPWVEDGDGSKEAGIWSKGLGDWGLGSAQIADLSERLALTVYTPGSQAGVPVDVLGAFKKPTGVAAEDPDARRNLVSGTVSGLLGLVGRKSDPVRDPAHIVLSRLLDEAWAAGEDPDLESLILKLVDPPFKKVGVFPLDRFFSPDDRMDLAMQLNGVIASPSFAAWTKGQALDVDAWMAPPEEAGGRTRVSIMSLAHLDESQRAFFLGLLLGRIQAWSRGQPGTSKLRGLVFFDEVAGWIPPHPHNPPTKGPLLNLMKQARAVGLGVVLATQNPVDIDYKGLSNAGLWAIGRLQTKQDRDRLLKGLGRPDLDGLVEGLGKRRFLVHRAKKNEPVVVGSRFAMCFLRGPMTATDLGRMEFAPPPGQEASSAPAPGSTPSPSPSVSAAPVGASAQAAASPPEEADDGLLPAPPPTPGDSWYLDPRVAFSARLGDAFSAHAQPHRDDGKTEWRPALYAEVAVTFDEDRVGFFHDARFSRVWFPLEDRLPDEAIELALDDADLLSEAPDGGRFPVLPSWMDQQRELTSISKRVVDQVYRGETMGMFVCKPLKLWGKPEEEMLAFRERCKEVVEERADANIAKLEEKVAKQVAKLEDRMERTEDKIADYSGAIKAAQAAEVVNVGETLWAMFSGRRKSLSTAMSKRQSTMRKEGQLTKAEAELKRLQEEAFELEAELQGEIARLKVQELDLLGEIEEREVRLEKNDVRLERFGVLWVPVTRRL